MKLEKLLTKKGAIFFAVFTILAYISMEFNFSTLLGMPEGQNQTFTFFQFMGPVAGGFLGAGIGVFAVLFAELINFILVGKETSIINVLRLLPMLFGAYYFAKNRERLLTDKLSVLIPILCMGLFILNPLAQNGWFYSLFWLIPVIAKFLPDRLFLRSLGATFIAHGVGTVVWIYSLSFIGTGVFPFEFWTMLMPVAFTERILFATGILVTYIAFNTILSKVDSLNIINLKSIITIEEKYAISTKSD
ncbi:MAG: hypothetical protein WC427_03585 [Candidatus Paceibacterota bacterium]